MAITYLKKADKTPQTGTEETRKIVSDMLAKIEAAAKRQLLVMARSSMDFTARRLCLKR